MLILTQAVRRDRPEVGDHLYDIAFVRGDLRLGYASAISLSVSLVTAALVALIFRWSLERE